MLAGRVTCELVNERRTEGHENETQPSLHANRLKTCILTIKTNERFLIVPIGWN